MALKNTKITQGISHVVLLAAIDDLLGIQKQAADTLVQKNDGDKLTQTDKTIIKRYEEGLQKTLDLIAPAGMEIKNSKIVLNDRHARVLYVYNWPNYLYPNWLAATINFDAEFDIAQYIYPSSNTIIMKMLRKKVTEMRASVRMLEQKGIVRDPVLEAALQDAEELRDLLARGREKLFQFGMYITLYEQDEKRLKKLETDIESLLGGKLVLTKPAVFQMEHAWNSTLPLCLDELEINRNMNTSPLATSFPFSSADLTSDHGILYGINRHNDSLVIFDRFDLPNANATVFATSGAGKSFMVKLEILRSLMFGTEVFVIDPENEYVELSETVGGSHIPISLQSSHRINPFDLPRAVRGEEAETGEILRASAINLHGLFKLMLGTLTPAEDGILDKAILDTYALKKITMDTEDTSGLEPPTMRDLVDVLSTTEGGEHMAQTLKKYTEGSYAGMFDQQTNIELEKQVVVFQIRDLEEQLRPIAMYVILNFLWNRIRADFKKRFLVIDEAWNLMQHEDSARFLYGLIKRARKYYLGITTITQDVEDFVNSPYGKPIITNASLQVLLKQSPSAVDNLQKLFYLTDGEKYLLLNSDVGQGLFFAENKHVAIQIVASPQEEQLITTKPEEVLAKKKVKKAKKDAASHAATTALNSPEKPVQEQAQVQAQVQEEQPAETTAPIEVPKATEAETEAQTPEPKEAPPKPNNESETHTEEAEVLQKIKPETPSNKKILNAVESLKSGESLERIVQMEMQENAERDSESAVQEEKIQGEREKEKHADEPPETTPQNPNAMPAPQEIPIEKKVPENPENPYLGIQPEKPKG